MSDALPLIGFFGWAWAAKEDSASDRGAGSKFSWTIPLGPSRAQQGELAHGAHGLVPLLFWGHGLQRVTGMTACFSQLGLPDLNNRNLLLIAREARSAGQLGSLWESISWTGEGTLLAVSSWGRKRMKASSFVNILVCLLHWFLVASCEIFHLRCTDTSGGSLAQ